MSDLVANFFSSYFHQDWKLEANTPEQIVAAYKKQAPPAEISQLAKEIHEYVSKHAEDVELERLLMSDLGCFYLPSADGMRARSWLLKVARQLASVSS